MKSIPESEIDFISDSFTFMTPLWPEGPSQDGSLSESGTETTTMSPKLPNNFSECEWKYDCYDTAPAVEIPDDDMRAVNDPIGIYNKLADATLAISEQQEQYLTIRAELLESAENLVAGLSKLHGCQEEQSGVSGSLAGEGESRLEKDCKGAVKSEGLERSAAEELKMQLCSVISSRDALKAQVNELKTALERKRVETMAIRVQYENAQVVLNLVHKVQLEKEREETKKALEAAEASQASADQHLQMIHYLEDELEIERRTTSIRRDVSSCSEKTCSNRGILKGWAAAAKIARRYQVLLDWLEQKGYSDVVLLYKIWEEEKKREEIELEKLENPPPQPSEFSDVESKRPPESEVPCIRRLKELSTSFAFVHRSRTLTAVQVCLHTIDSFDCQIFSAGRNPLTERCIPWPILQPSTQINVEDLTTDMFHTFFANAGQTLPLAEYKDLLKALFRVFEPDRWCARYLTEFATGTSTLMEAIESPNLKKAIVNARKMVFQALAWWLLEIV